MNKRPIVLLALIILWTAISRFFLIGVIPPIFSDAYLQGRIFGGCISCLTVILLYFFSKKLTSSIRVALLSSFMYAMSPWTIEQGRIISEPSITTASLVCMLLVLFFVRQSLIRALIIILLPNILSFTYPSMWFLHTQKLISLEIFIKNISFLVSSEFLFFRNPTFWWGGVRDWGILYMTSLPFLLTGIYALWNKHMLHIGVIYILFNIIAALNPTFPEAREMYLGMPFLCIIVAMGFQVLRRQSGLMRLILYGLIIVLIYESSQFFHYYTVHYPQQVRGNASHLNEAF